MGDEGKMAILGFIHYHPNHSRHSGNLGRSVAAWLASTCSAMLAMPADWHGRGDAPQVLGAAAGLGMRSVGRWAGAWACGAGRG